MIRFSLFWCIAGIFEYPFLEVFFSKGPLLLDRHPFFSLGLHVLSLVILFFSLPKEKGWFHAERIRPKLFILLAGFFPVFGWAAVGIFQFFGRSLAVQPSPEIEEKRTILNEAPSMMNSLAMRQTRILEALDFVPLADILAGEEMELKRGAIDRLAELKTPEAIQILLDCRSDPSPDVRFFATSALTRIKRELDEELEGARRQMQKKMSEVQTRIFLAKIYLQYSNSHLLDTATAESYEHEALYHLDYCVQSGNASREAFEMLISIYTLHQEWDKVLKTIGDLEASGKGDPLEIGKMKMEVYYKTGQFGKMLQEMAQMKQKELLDGQLGSIASFWGVY